VVGVPTEAGAEHALGDHPGLRGGAFVEPGHADTVFLS